MTNYPFYKFILPVQKDLFQELSQSVDFEAAAKGRNGNHLVRPNDGKVPIVRTTTKYNTAAQRFSAIHNFIAESIKQEVSNNHEIQSESLDFNNALIEIYDDAYTKMKFHSDQCLDLEENSYIALFSCYERPDELTNYTLRKLKVQSKTTEESFEFLLEHNSIILFSVSTNAKFLHKIVLEGGKNLSNNRWLGMTFRQSKTFIHFKEDLPYFSNGELLKLADEAQSKAFYHWRTQENNSINFIYPNISYTLSVSDTLAPK